MTHGKILSNVGRLIQIPGCQGTVCYPLGLQAHLQGPSGVDRDVKVPPCLTMYHCGDFAGFLSYGVVLSSAGLIVLISGCRGTACSPLGLGTPLQAPSGVDRDVKDPLA